MVAPFDIHPTDNVDCLETEGTKNTMVSLYMYNYPQRDDFKDNVLSHVGHINETGIPIFMK